MNLFRTIFAICRQNFRKWKTDYRIWIIAATMIIMVQIYVDDMRKISEYLCTDIPVWIFPFLFSQFHTKLIYTLPVILLFCNAPFPDGNQVFVFTRVGRKKWLCGQILYIVIAAAVYYIFLLIISLASTVLVGEISMEWGKTLHTLAVSNVAWRTGCVFVDISNLVVDFFTPLQAILFTFLVSWLCAVFLGLTILFCNTVFRNKVVGTIVSSSFVVLSVLVENGGYSMLIPYSPVSWNTLDNIDVGGLTTNPSIEYCVGVYLILITVLIAGTFAFCRKQNLDMKGS